MPMGHSLCSLRELLVRTFPQSPAGMGSKRLSSSTRLQHLGKTAEAKCG